MTSVIEQQGKPALRSARRLLGYTVLMKDGGKGKLADILFDESTWGLCYFVIETGSLLLGRQVLLGSSAVSDVREGEKALILSVSGHDIRKSPHVSTKLPVSREAELLLAKYWQWATPDAGPLPPMVSQNITAEASPEEKRLSEAAAESRLRSTKETLRYAIRAAEGRVGRLKDMLCGADWHIRYVAAGTRNWLPGRRVLLPVRFINEIRWSDKSVHVSPSRDLIRRAPGYDPERQVTEADEKSVSNHFGIGRNQGHA